MNRKRLAVVLVSLVVSTVVAELALRRSVPGWAVLFPPVNFRPDLFEEAPFGYRLKPGPARPYRYPRDAVRPVTVTPNAQGFRSRRDFGEPDARPRIVVLGDSMVFGQGVEEPERVTERLEARRPDWRVENLGMVGYGTDLMLRALEAVGLDSTPRAVVLAVFTDDLRRVVAPYAGTGFRLPRYALEDGELRTVPYPEPWPWERLRLFQGVRYAWWRYTDATFALNEAILDRFHALARERGFVPAVLFLPGPSEHADDHRRRDFLRRWAERRGVAFLDVGGALRASGGEALYLPGDPHWNAAGHDVVARELEAFLAREVLD